MGAPNYLHKLKRVLFFRKDSFPESLKWIVYRVVKYFAPYNQKFKLNLISVFSSS